MSYYEPGKNQFLSGQVLLLLDVSAHFYFFFKQKLRIKHQLQLPVENKAIFDQVSQFGGQYRDDFSEDVTCLVCIEPRGVNILP